MGYINHQGDDGSIGVVIQNKEVYLIGTNKAILRTIPTFSLPKVTELCTHKMPWSFWQRVGCHLCLQRKWNSPRQLPLPTYYQVSSGPCILVLTLDKSRPANPSHLHRPPSSYHSRNEAVSSACRENRHISSMTSFIN